MKGVEKIYQGKKLIAMIFRSYLQVKDVEFFTDDTNPFQLGAHDRKKGVSLRPHVHTVTKPLTIKSIQEWLFIPEGKVRVVLYTKKGEVLYRKILTAGDSILLMEGGHGVEFLEDSKIFEIKQGPYLPSHHSKLFLK